MDIDGLIKQFERMEDDIEDDVHTIVENNTIELTDAVQESEEERFDQGYWTGNSYRKTDTHILDKLHYMTKVNTEYAAYLEYGTRYYQGAVNFFYNPYYKQEQQFKEDIHRLLKG